MADFIGEITPQDIEDLEDTKSAPPSPRGGMSKEATMADITDDEVVINAAKQQGILDNQETPNQNTDPLPLDGDPQIRSPPRPVRATSPP